MAMREDQIEELTKEKRMSARGSSRVKKSNGQKGLKTSCECGNTIPITPGTRCPGCKILRPEIIPNARGRQVCQGCGGREVKANEPCTICSYTWTKGKEEDVDYTKEDEKSRTCDACKRPTPKENDYCGHCGTNKISGLTVNELVDAAGAGVASGPTAPKDNKADRFTRDRMLPTTNEKSKARRAYEQTKRGERVAERRKLPKKPEINAYSVKSTRRAVTALEKKLQKLREVDSDVDDEPVRYTKKARGRTGEDRKSVV